ncbi:hypothetical protein L596_012952 [Steinernema carpocapsae]|uniref:Enolase-phosphatase E1 n=1 Tax=Steinernema carpocapsae TaxID=34508 RepID=A0A4U5NYS8_STECR|nr:hypothetical protein L596_012952 [Steinernema carpocapsae]
MKVRLNSQQSFWTVSVEPDWSDVFLDVSYSSKSSFWSFAAGKQVGIHPNVYPDVFPVLQKLHSSGTPIYIYSSGSVQAQKLLFKYSLTGDITTILSGYFDTNIGYKQDSTSYEKIAVSIKKDPAKILFLTDVEKEAYAAKAAGFQCKLVLREGNAPLTEQALKDFKTICNFKELL